MIIMGFAERIQKLRKIKRLSQSDVARSIGVSPSIVSNYERSERLPSLDKLISLASLFRCSTDYLLGLDSKPSDMIDVSMLD